MSLFKYTAKHFIFTLMSLLISALILAGCLYCYMMFSLPNVATLKDARLQIPLRIYTQDGQLIGEYGYMRRDPVKLNQVPKQLLQAVIATEDQRFFEHSGVDLIGIVRAAHELLVTGQRSQGASTITMQVARNFFLTPEKTFTRKINEILLALKINGAFSKEDILELYLNKIYLGQHAYGVSAAAEIYYGKSLDQLTLPEIAMIAGLPQAPSKENPISNPNGAKERRNHVLERMLEGGYIDKHTYETALEAPVETYYHGAKIAVEARHVAEMVRNIVYQQFGEAGYVNGLEVYTTLDSHLQEKANQALRDGLVAYEQRHRGYRGPEKNLRKISKNLTVWQGILADMPEAEGFIPVVVTQLEANKIVALLANGHSIQIYPSGWEWMHADINHVLKTGDVIWVIQKEGEWQITQLPKVEGAIVALNPDDGAVLALNGGFGSDTGFNRAVQAERQPGSNFKPFIYAAGLAHGYTLATVVDDAPIEINDTGDPNNLWRPQNDEKQFFGPTRLRVALVKSLNLVTIRLLQMTGISEAIQYISNFGFNPSDLPHSLSLALGTPDVTPMQMAQGYAVFANQGYRVVPYFIRHIKNKAGKSFYEAHPPTVLTDEEQVSQVTPTHSVPTRAIEPDIAYLMNNVLQDVIQNGTGRGAKVLDRTDIAGKTGTSNRGVDAWFSGFNRHLVTTVWVGYDQPRPLNEHGAQAALPIWIDFMKEALAGQPEMPFKVPANIVSVKIDPVSGLLAYPEQNNAIFEVFIQGTEPTQVADISKIFTPTNQIYYGNEYFNDADF